MTGCPGPLKIESTQVAGHINHLADEIQARHFFRRHRGGRKLVGIHASQCDLSGAITLGAVGVKHPMLKPLGDGPQFRRAILAQRPAVEIQLAEALGQPFGQ